MTEKIAKFRGTYKTQRDNVKAYYLHGSNYVDENGKVLFAAKDIDKEESRLFDRTTECFISTGSMFTDALANAKIIANPIDELAYKLLIRENVKGKETRFHWSAHERVMDTLIKNKSYDFYTFKAKGNENEIIESIDQGFPCMVSIWIQPWYPSGRGHLVLVVGYKTDDSGKLLGFIVDDPFGDCTTKYINKNGEKVFYSVADWNKMMNSPNDKPRYMGRIKQK